jgi:hypothetical protein
VGKFTGELGSQGPCLNCSWGQYMDSEGAKTCLLCPAGKYQQSFGASDCDSCPLGRAQSEPGQTSCQFCSVGFYSLTVGQAFCFPYVQLGLRCIPWLRPMRDIVLRSS